MESGERMERTSTMDDIRNLYLHRLEELKFKRLWENQTHTWKRVAKPHLSPPTTSHTGDNFEK